MFKNNNSNTEKKNSVQIWFNMIYSMIIDSIKDISNFRELKQKKDNLDINIDLLNNIDKNEVNLNIFFKRNRIKFVVEKWTFTIIKNTENDKLKFININKIHKKLLIMNKSIKFLLKFLPLYQLYKSKEGNFNFQLELEIEINKNDINMNENKESIFMEPLNDNIFGKFNLKIEYILKDTIFKIEDELKDIIIQENSERIYYLSNNDENKFSDESNNDSSKSDDNIDLCENERKEIECLELNNNDIDFDIEEENESSYENEIICVEDKITDDNNFIKDNYSEKDDLFDFGKYDENQNEIQNNDNDLQLMSEIKVKKPLNILQNFYRLKHNTNIIFINNNNLNKLVNEKL